MQLKKRFVFLPVLLLGVLVFLFKNQLFSTQENNSVVEVLDTPFEPKASSLNVGLQIDVSSFESMLDRQMDARGWMYQEENVEVNNDLMLSFRVKKEGNAYLYPQMGKLALDLPLLIEIKAKARAPIAIPITKTYDMTSRLSLHSEIDVDYESDWSLSTKPETTYKIQESPEISILGKKVNFEKQLKQSLDEAIPMINSQIEEQIKSVINTRGIAESIWDTFRVPYNISSEPFAMWATLYPQEATATPIKPAGPGEVGTTINISSQANVFLGKEPIADCMDELPAVSRISKAKSKYSEVHVPLFLEIDSMVSYINRSYDYFQVPIPKRKEPVQLSNFRAQREAGKLRLEAEFKSANITGTLTLKGIPKYDSATESIFIDNLEVSSNSNNILVDQLVKTLKKNKKLKEALRYRITDDISKLTFDLTNQIKAYEFGDYARLDGYIEKITINDLLLQENYIVLDTSVKGQLKCLVGISQN